MLDRQVAANRQDNELLGGLGIGCRKDSSSTLQARPKSKSRPGLAAFAGALLIASPANAETIGKEEMLRGITMTQAQCVAIPQTVWVNAYGLNFCVRYYMSTAGGEGRHPVVFLDGDQLGPLDDKALQWKDHSKATDVDTADLMNSADSFSKMAKTTAIYLARIGVDGSSGDHRSRKTMLELQFVNAALDAIKQRHGFEGFHLAGQSGGSQLLAGLIGLRNDIVCAVAGSGQFLEINMRGDPARTYFNAAKFISDALQRRSLRLLVVTDPADKKVPAKMQTAYVQQFRNAGHPIPQFFVEGTDDKHHGVVQYTRLAVSGCVLGKSDMQIGRAIQTLVTRSVERNAQKQRETQAKARINLASQRPI
jgi:hypothetical protein